MWTWHTCADAKSFSQRSHRVAVGFFLFFLVFATVFVSSPVATIFGLVVALFTLVDLSWLYDLQVSVGLQVSFVVSLACGGVVALLACVLFRHE